MKLDYRPEDLKELRKRLGFSFADVARRISAPLEDVKKWEMGVLKPSDESLAKLEILFHQAQLCCQDVQTSAINEKELLQTSLNQIQTKSIN